MFSSVFDGPVVDCVCSEMECGAAGVPCVHTAHNMQQPWGGEQRAIG